MGPTRAEHLAADRKAPRDGQIIRLVTSTTPASFDLSQVNLPNGFDANARQHVFVSVRAIGAQCNISTSPLAVTLNNTTTGQTAGLGWPIPASFEEEFIVSRVTDKFLNYVATGAGELWIYTSSTRTDGPP